jgi:PAS domain S-box-containing protein
MKVGGEVEGGGAASGPEAKIEELENRLAELSDIEERCRSLEKERDEAQRLLQQMVGTASDALENLGERTGPLGGIISALHDTFILGIDRNGRYLFYWIDPALEARYGIRAGDLRGKSLKDMFPPDEAESRLVKTRRTFDTGERFHEEYRLDFPSGEVWHEATVAPMRDADGAVTAVVGIVHDVTARKRAEEERNRLLSKIRRAEKLESLGILAAGIAHDFSSLMIGVLGNTGLLLEELPADSLARRKLLGIEQAAQQAYDLIEHLRACTGQRTFDLQPHDLAELSERSIELVRASIPGNVSLQLKPAPGLPPARVDATQIVQVLTNLLQNASEAIGGRAGTVEVRIEKIRADRAFLASTYLNQDLSPGEYLSVEVEDDGCGMTEQQLSRVFDPFFTTKSNGRGLGLASLPGILRGHSGDVRVKSRAGQGTVFQLLLPPDEGGAAK